MVINRNCILRLSKYKKSVARLRSLGFKKVFSDNLADAIGVTSSQVRKDFSIFGITGNRKGGYDIDELIEKLNSLLGKNDEERVILVGLGNVGTALMKYNGFKKEGINIIAAFDSDPAKVNYQSVPPVLPAESVADFIMKNSIRTAIIAVPDLAAQGVFDTLVRSGIKGVLNFAPMHLRAPSDIVISNVNLEMELETVIYFVNTNGGVVGVDNQIS
jgi:redox-sensing transcriptional repressor